MSFEIMISRRREADASFGLRISDISDKVNLGAGFSLSENPAVLSSKSAGLLCDELKARLANRTDQSQVLLVTGAVGDDFSSQEPVMMN